MKRAVKYEGESKPQSKSYIRGRIALTRSSRTDGSIVRKGNDLWFLYGRPLAQPVALVARPDYYADNFKIAGQGGI
jgi:hypothetical protein